MTRAQKILYNTGLILRKLRMNKGVNQIELSAVCDFNTGSYSRMESGLRDMKLSDIFMLAAYYKLTPSELIEMIEKGSIEIKEGVI